MKHTPMLAYSVAVTLLIVDYCSTVTNCNSRKLQPSHRSDHFNQCIEDARVKSSQGSRHCHLCGQTRLPIVWVHPYSDFYGKCIETAQSDVCMYVWMYECVCSRPITNCELLHFVRAFLFLCDLCSLHGTSSPWSFYCSYSNITSCPQLQ